MTVFEYLMVMVSMVLALALAQLLRGATEVFTNSNRYWVHGTWVLVAIFMIIQTWWAFWDWSSFTNWNFLSFLFVLSFAIALFITAYLLIPANRTADLDWYSHFYEIRRYLFITLACIGVLGVTLSWVLLGTSLLHPYRIFQLIFITLSVVGVISSNRKIHGPLVVIYFLLFITSQVALRLQIGALVNNG